MTRRRSLLRAVAGLGAAAIALVAYLQFLWVPSWDFPPARPFAGSRWFNPYEGATGEALRVNFHVHARAWGGLAPGKGSSESIYAAYQALGYDLAAISNYQSIAPPPESGLSLPTYEHGIGAGKQHQTVVGADRVVWLDYPAFQTATHEQHVVEALRDHAELVFLNHPGHVDAYSLAEMSELTGYDGLEIASRFGNWTGHWDAALSAGRPVWGVASDDCHDVGKPKYVGRGWLMVHAAARTSDAIVAALKVGRFHAVWTDPGATPNRLLECRVDRDRLELRCAEPADSIRLIGQGGALLAELTSRPDASWPLAPSDSYVRAEVRTRGATLYLNPILRTDGDRPTAPRAVLLRGPTLLKRIGGAIALLAAALLGPLRCWRRRVPIA